MSRSQGEFRGTVRSLKAKFVEYFMKVLKTTLTVLAWWPAALEIDPRGNLTKDPYQDWWGSYRAVAQ